MSVLIVNPLKKSKADQKISELAGAFVNKGNGVAKDKPKGKGKAKVKSKGKAKGKGKGKAIKKTAGLNKKVIQINETRPIDYIHPYPNNPRKHSPEQIDELVASIKEFGFTMPILIDEDSMILAGHGRWQAAAKMGMIHVPVLVHPGLTEIQKKAYVIADNRLALNAAWDLDTLREEIGALMQDDFEIELLGFGDDLDKFLGEPTAPTATVQFQPKLESEVLIEVRCTKLHLEGFKNTIDKWGLQKGVDIQITG